MPAFDVTLSEMSNAANKISQQAQEFLNVAGQVFQAAQTLAGSWEGDSQVAFVAEQQQANEWYKKMVDIVNTYVDMLNKAVEKYRESDEQAAQAVKSK